MTALRMACAIAVVAICSSSARAQGLVSPGAGPINRSMAGASTAAPVDFGSTYWNPANLSGLVSPEFLLGSELIIPSTEGRGRLTEITIDGDRGEVRVIKEGLANAAGVTQIGETALVLVER